MMMGAYGGMMPPMYGGYGKGKGKSSPQLNVDASKKLWIGNIPEQATWRDLQTLVDQVVKSRWVEIFRGRGKGTACVVYGSSEEAHTPVVVSGVSLDIFLQLGGSQRV
ncbi:hypothetical protein AK812_SmicGene17245 [Symbiodinium microadriaticum]|uniref:RRM domain-containing protein n=1 Tax=Symbiodinium microadriaticum TaxID=2951 RepID=A0A1Q9DY90_SYMMI|nr:hypothetical protein AK812_SmicGene17245 [Symbiodinium microadriaticum]